MHINSFLLYPLRILIARAGDGKKNKRFVAFGQKLTGACKKFVNMVYCYHILRYTVT